VVAAHFGEVQTLLLLALVYLALIGPISLVARLFGADFLGKRTLRQGSSAWNEADTSEPSLERTKHPF
jgi:hypothetical protein